MKKLDDDPIGWTVQAYGLCAITCIVAMVTVVVGVAMVLR